MKKPDAHTHKPSFITILLLSISLLSHALPSHAKLVYKNIIHNLPTKLKNNVEARFAAQQNVPATKLHPDVANNWYFNGQETIRKALEPFGYFNPSINSRLDKRGNMWLASYTVNPGPVTHIKAVSLTLHGKGQAEPRLQALKTQLPIKVGDVYNSQAYDQSKDNIFHVATTLGFLNAKLSKSEVQIDRQHHQATIIFVLETGPRAYFGKIRFNQTPFKTSFLRRFLNIHEGQAYQPQALITLQQNLANSHYFQHVSVKPLTKQAINHHIPINVHLIPYKSQQYLIGLGWGTDTKIRGTLGLNLRRLTSTGQHFSAIVQASNVQNALEARYIIPGPNPLTDQFSLGIGIENLTPQNSRSQSTKFNVSYINNQKTWQRTIGITYQHDRFHINDNPTHKINTLYPSISFLRVFADNPIHTMNGSRINFHMLGGSKHFGSNIYFSQIETSGKLIQSFFKGSRLLLRGILGHTAVDNRDTLPLSFQYFAGGAQSVRGYGFQDLGPGRSTIVGSIEWQQRFIGNWYLAGFYDIGNAFNDNFIKAAGKLKRSAGAGLVLMTAIGPLELSVAKPLHDPNHKDWHIQFSMGPDL